MSVSRPYLQDSVAPASVDVDLDRDDLRIIRSLQLAPRASFARLGATLGLPERTVARRYRTLHGAGVIRVVGLTNPVALGQQVWMVRVHCRPDGTEALASALAQRDDISWVALAAAGSEIHFSMRALSEEQRDLLLTRRLPRASPVLNIEAAVVLHHFLGFRPDDWDVLAEVLTAAETRAVRAESVTTGATTEAAAGALRLEPHDEAIIAALGRDGRAGYAELAAAAGISEGRVTRRLAALLESGTVVLDLDVASAALGYRAAAYLYLRVTPARLQEVGEALAAQPEVPYVAATTGPYNLLASVKCRDLADLYALSTTRVGNLDGVHTMELSPVLRTVKQAGTLTDRDRLAARPARTPA